MPRSVAAGRAVVPMSEHTEAVQDVRPLESSTSSPMPSASHSRPRSSRACMLLAVVALGLTIHFAQAVLLPVLVGAFFALLLNPLLARLSGWWLPRWLGALLLLGILVAGLVAAGNAVYEPALQAAENAPRTAYRLKQRVLALTREPMQQADAVGKAMDVIGELRGQKKGQTVTVVDPAQNGDALSRFSDALTTTASVLILIYFLLVYGENGLRRVVEVAPSLSDKRRTVAVVRSVQAELSRYVLTITSINIALGVAATALFYALGVEDYLLWGAMAALLNFAPYLGPLVGFLLMLAVGLLQFDQAGAQLAPAAGYLALNILESQAITPMILGRNFSLNPPIILIWLLLWAWLWGMAGLLLAVPLLVCFKVLLAHHPNYGHWARALER